MLQEYLFEKFDKIGDKIPSERTIAEDLNVNRTTLRSAIHRMVKNGLLERQVGVGTFFKVDPKNIEEYNLEEFEYKTCEILKMRMMLEPEICSAASAIFIDSCYEKLTDLMNSSCDDPDLLDSEIIKVVLEEADNSLIEKTYCDIWLSGQNYVFEDISIWRKHQTAIFDAMKSKDQESIKKAVKNKITLIIEEYFDGMEVG